MLTELEQAPGTEHREHFGADGRVNRAACQRPAKHKWGWIEVAVAAGVADQSVADPAADLAVAPAAGFADPAARTRTC